jgi:hypothetical protein
MAYTNIDDPSAHFQVLTYTGNGSHPRNLTNDGNSDLKPDFIWGKNRTSAGTNHSLTNSTLGFDAPNAPTSGGVMASDSTGIENTPSSTYGYLSAALTDGFTASAGGTNGDNWNENSANFVAWQWKANGGTTSSNTDGSITSTVQANTTAGFSIVTYTGNGSASTIGHGLGVAPELIIIKNRDATDPWAVYFRSNYLVLNTTVGWAASSAFWNNTAPSSTVFTVNTDHSVNADAEAYVAYCFAEKQGYSKFGTYYGNASTDGAYVHLGFKPALVIFKVLSDPNYGWSMIDNKRSPSNLMNDDLYANSTAAEVTNANNIDFLSNGFKCRGSTYPANAGGTNTFLYIAFGETPFVTSTGIPTTAR